jgi:hypothetical protein
MPSSALAAPSTAPHGAEQSTSAAPARAPRDAGVTLRVVFLSLALAAVFGVIIPFNDYKFGNTYLGAAHLPPGAVAALLLVLVVHGVVKVLSRTSQRLLLSRNEVLTFYITCLFSAVVPGRAAENFFVTNLIAPFYFATPENRWLDFLQQYLKPWFTPALTSSGQYNKALVEGWYVGGSVPWSFWLVPLLAWSALIFAVYVLLACLAVMLRAQWAEKEALSFPLLKLPLELTEDLESTPGKRATSLLRNPITWAGVGIAVFIQLLNGLNLYFPDVPAVPLSVDTGPLFTEAPWNQIGQVPLRVLPIAVGISYLLTSEVSFSLWFFFLLHKLQYIIAYSIGFAPVAMPDPVWTRGFSKSFISYQQIGAYFAYALILFWIGREHFKHIAKRAFGRTKATNAEKNEALPYPVAFWGFVAASLFILLWTCAAGVRPSVAIVLWFTYLVIIIGLTRVVAEGGLLYINHGWSPLLPIANLFGAGPGAWLGPGSAVPFSIMQGAFMVDMKGLLLPAFLQGLKLAHDRGIAVRRLLLLIFGVIAVAFCLGVWTNVRLGYQYGGLSLHDWFARNGAQDPARNALQIVRGQQADWLNWFWLVVGAATMWGIQFMRAQTSWFPLHPIGFLMWSPYVTHQFWFSIFCGWLCKVLLTRFGGNETYRRLTPAFLGLVLGDILMMIFWAGIDAWQGRSGHLLMPG